MTGPEIVNLINVGGKDRARKKLKRMSIPDRLKTLNKCIPYVNATTESLKFFRNNFSVELGSILAAEYDLGKAETIYKSSVK